MGIVQSGLVGAVRNDGVAQVTAEITEQRWLALARALIVAGQPAAENPLDPDMPPGREEGISELVAAKLSDLGLSVDLVSKRAGRPNVIGTLVGAAPDGPTLILNDHLDTYPAGDPARWTKTGGDPFRPTRDGDFLYARGTSDTRGNLACTHPRRGGDPQCRHPPRGDTQVRLHRRRGKERPGWIDLPARRAADCAPTTRSPASRPGGRA